MSELYEGVSILEEAHITFHFILIYFLTAPLIVCFTLRLFQVEKRVEARVTKWQESLEMELKAQREAALFKARDPHVLNKEPFIPKASEKPLSEIDNFELHSDRRAAEREQYERMKKQKEAELEGMKRQVSLVAAVCDFIANKFFLYSYLCIRFFLLLNLDGGTSPSRRRGAGAPATL